MPRCANTCKLVDSPRLRYLGDGVTPASSGPPAAGSVTRKVQLWVTEAWPSDTVTVMACVPWAVGVPEIRPAADRVKLAGAPLIR